MALCCIKSDQYFLDEGDVSSNAAILCLNQKDSALVNTQIGGQFSPSHGKSVTICNLKGSWRLFSCGRVITLIENSWFHILQLHPRLPFVEMALSVVLNNCLSGTTVYSFMLSLTHENDPGSSVGALFLYFLSLEVFFSLQGLSIETGPFDLDRRKPAGVQTHFTLYCAYRLLQSFYKIKTIFLQRQTTAGNLVLKNCE